MTKTVSVELPFLVLPRLRDGGLSSQLYVVAIINKQLRRMIRGLASICSRACESSPPA